MTVARRTEIEKKAPVGRITALRWGSGQDVGKGFRNVVTRPAGVFFFAVSIRHATVFAPVGWVTAVTVEIGHDVGITFAKGAVTVKTVTERPKRKDTVGQT